MKIAFSSWFRKYPALSWNMLGMLPPLCQSVMVSRSVARRGVHQGSLQVLVVHFHAVGSVAIATGSGGDAKVSALLGQTPIWHPVVQVYERLKQFSSRPRVARIVLDGKPAYYSVRFHYHCHHNHHEIQPVAVPSVNRSRPEGHRLQSRVPSVKSIETRGA